MFLAKDGSVPASLARQLGISVTALDDAAQTKTSRGTALVRQKEAAAAQAKLASLDAMPAHVSIVKAISRQVRPRDTFVSGKETVLVVEVARAWK
jgi:hypothetical protein